jgi:hypothetical protein
MFSDDTLPPLPESERTYDHDVMAAISEAEWLAFQRDLEADWRL